MKVSVIQTIKGKNTFLQTKYQGKPQNILCEKRIILYPDKRMQKLIGFGGAFTEAAAYTFSKLSIEKKKQVIDAYFDPESGIGYTLGRIAISSCDFSFGHYTYVSDDNKDLTSFSIEHENMWVIPMLEAARDTLGHDIKLFAAPWSPPPWMKDNKRMTHGGSLLPEYYDVWAKYFVKTVCAYQSAGFPLYAVSTQNEPEAVQTWESCIYTAEQERDFIKNHLGPAIKNAGLDTKITIWDHNRDMIVERAKVVLGDPEAARYVWGTAFHWYVSEEFENVGLVHKHFPDKHLIFTEGCIEGGTQPGSWETGERYGRNIISDFNNWNEGFIDWNLILDETGGPNHVGNFCDTPIVVDTQTNTLVFNSSYYYIAHFSKYIRPGAIRIGCESIKEVLSTAFINPDGSIVSVMQNQNDNAVHCLLILGNEEHALELNPHSITTVIWTKI